ncbi:hypothetical protein BLNAU_7427 [Blattamonas nauphoetae]|uniref:Uncharacterized protein n=1 Tax=Blattamonas nauphoetae TaxID=2049346 RepID=A0ABQ9Y1B2_9EUKA|nr:hypothetical protein BLNAU_7427 [Blattamonas nauphoetae]
MDCSPFLNWNENQSESEKEKAVVYRSLVATVKSQPALDVSLEAKAVKFLESVVLHGRESVDRFLFSLGRTADESLTNFVHWISVLFTSTSQVINTAAVKMLETLVRWCSPKVRLALVQADLIPQLFTSLNPLSLSFDEAADIHVNLMKTIAESLWLPTPNILAELKCEDRNEQQVVYETVLKQVLVPSEKYIRLLCVNRFSIIDGSLSMNFLEILARLLAICPYYRPTMDFVLHMPVFLTIPSCLTFFENEMSISCFLASMATIQWEWNMEGGEVQQRWKTMHRVLRMEGIEDVIEAKLQNDKTKFYGGWITFYSFRWNNQLGMNDPKLW